MAILQIIIKSLSTKKKYSVNTGKSTCGFTYFAGQLHAHIGKSYLA